MPGLIFGFGCACFTKTTVHEPFHEAAYRRNVRNSASRFPKIKVPPILIRPMSEGVTEHVFFRRRLRFNEPTSVFLLVFSTDQCCFAINYSLRAYRITLYNNSSFPFYDKTIDETLSVNPKENKNNKEEYLNNVFSVHSRNQRTIL